MRVCLFGCGGFIGSHLAEWLLEHPDIEVVGTDIQHGKILHLLDAPRFTFYDSDLRHDRELTRRLIETSDVCVDLVGITAPSQSPRDAIDVFRLDLLENLWVAEVCAETQTRLVQFSSCEVYGKTWPSVLPEGLRNLASGNGAGELDITMREDETPLIIEPVHKSRWVYAASKHLLERAIHAVGESHGLDYTIIRPFNFMGPRFEGRPSEAGDEPPRLFAQFMEALLHGTPMTLVDGGTAQRTFIYIEDAIECVGRIVTDQTGATSREIFNIGNPRNEVTIAGLAQLMRDRYVERHWDRVAPLPEIASVPATEFFVDGEGYDDSDRIVPDIGKALRLLDWEPRWSLEDLVTATMDALVAEHEQSRAKAELASLRAR
jgi:UDP-apiose/xylose synthase